jgi:hypothetical protein
MRLAPSPALLLFASLGAAAACLVDLQSSVDCGDGFIDAYVGEDCEPGDVAGYAGRCEGGMVPGPDACDPGTCRFHADRCTSCGNGVVDAGEQCDPADMNEPTCLGEGVAKCRDDCTLDLSGCARCGNGTVDFDEECDIALTLGDLAAEIPCSELASPAGISRRYGSGVATKCTDKCEWDRSGCSYCQNDRLEDDEVVDNLYVDFEQTIKPVPEVCDKTQADQDKLIEHCQDACGSNYRVECKFQCASDCQAFEVAAVPTEELGCCTARGEDCPYDPITHALIAGRSECCRTLTHPDEDPCENLTVETPEGTQLFYLCR